MSAEIRLGVPQDAAAICEIWNEVIAHSTATFTTTPKTVEDVAERLEGQGLGNSVLVAIEAGGLVGFAMSFPFRSGPGYAGCREHAIYIKEGHQGHGLGARLLTSLEAQLERDGTRHMIAAISGENPRAVAFHAAHGFEETARMPGVGEKWGRRLDLILMQKTIEKL